MRKRDKKSAFTRVFGISSAMVFTALCLISNSGSASNYPADMPKRSDFQRNGPAQIQRDLQNSGAIALNIKYDGHLSQSHAVSVNVKIVYQDGTREALFEMSRFGAGWETRITNGCLVGRMGGCQTYGTDVMKHLLFWAARTPMLLNALHVELAFVDDQGRWDSNNSNNYICEFGELR